MLAAHPIAKGLESGPARFHDGCSRLRSWAYSSLDLYKHELLRVLYPVFIHCFMDLVAKGHIQEVISGQPSSISDDPEAVTLCGSSQDAANQLLEDSLDERLEKAGALPSDSEKGMGKPKKGRMKRLRKDHLKEEAMCFNQESKERQGWKCIWEKCKT
ncbi:hypothetical protein K1719_024075 [Acacia pycnantha]|nr:hypothetical protein K1719_024075 [Acacia pycnantha]